MNRFVRFFAFAAAFLVLLPGVGPLSAVRAQEASAAGSVLSIGERYAPSQNDDISRLLNAAIRQLSDAGGGTVLLPAGRFYWSTAPEAPLKGIVLRGRGPESTVLVFSHAPEDGLVLGSYDHDAHDGFRIERVHVVSNGTPLRLRGMDQAAIVDTRFQSTPVILDNCYAFRLANNIFNRGSIQLAADEAGSGFGTNQLVIENNVFNNTFTLQVHASSSGRVPFESLHFRHNWLEDFEGTGHVGVDLALPGYSPLWIESNTFVGIGVRLRSTGMARAIRVVDNQVSKGEQLDPWLTLEGPGFVESRVMHNHGIGRALQNGFIDPDVASRASRLLVLNNTYESSSGRSPTYVQPPPVRRIHETLRLTKTTGFEVTGPLRKTGTAALVGRIERLEARLDSLQQRVR